MSKFWKGFSVGFLACVGLIILFISYGMMVSTGGGLKEPLLTPINTRKQLLDIRLTNVYTSEQTTIPNDKIVFLNVWQTWCGPCLSEMKSIENLYKKYSKNSNVKFFVISDEAIAKVKKVVTEEKIDLPFFVNIDALSNEIEGETVPRTYIIHNGKVVLSETGARKWDSPKVFEFISNLEKQP